MFHSVRVVGRGRVGAAVSARLAERGCDVREAEGDPADLVLLCVPDAAIAEVAQSVTEGPWVAHVSGATPLTALDPHRQRFSVHPLQTFVRWRGPEQLDGAWAAISAESQTARANAMWLAQTLGLRPFDLAEPMRATYHAGAAIASNFLVTLFQSAALAFERAGAPPEGLVPLMMRTVENHFELTGPIARGDRATVEAHLAALARHAPELEAMYRALAALTHP
jgi:predicted short-subunit dehydrogenase-like oxidoreductase (DUF2520 family)